MMAAEEGRLEEARAHWARAISLDPRESGKLLPLASLLGRAGREAEARAYLELFAAAAPPALYARDIERARQYLARGGGPRRR
jgi:Tfp pilus assembly protein PilF